MTTSAAEARALSVLTFFLSGRDLRAGGAGAAAAEEILKALREAGVLANDVRDRALIAYGRKTVVSEVETAWDHRWKTAIDWLLNEVDANDFVAPFWAYCDGLITEKELRSGQVPIKTLNRRRERAEARALAAPADGEQP